MHERVEAEKAEDLPELHQVRPMLAAGWGGNGAVTANKAALALQILRTGSDNAPFIRDSMVCMSIDMAIGAPIPAVWRTGRTHAAARVDGMSSAGMDDIEIPAFLRKQADGDESKPTKQAKQKTKDSGPSEERTVRRKESSKTPQASPDELLAILDNKSVKDNPVHEFLKCYNQAALSHTQFRSALATCLRTNQAGYLQWLVTKHMKAAGSGAPVWAVFIQWAAEKLFCHLDRHAERLLRDFLKSVKPEVQASVRADLDALGGH